jgi:hypothetical protein
MAFRKVLECKEISLQYSSSGTATLDFLTDIAALSGSFSAPGALASALTAPVTLPSTLGVGKRQTITIPLDGIRATEFAVKIVAGTGAPATQFELYAATLYIRPIGVYLNGAAPNGGEIWQTVPIAPGI